jgi:hypothetical protein
MDSILLDTNAVVYTLSVAIDTGTSLILGDPVNVAKFYDAIPNSRPAPEVGDGLFACKSVFYAI